MGVSCAGVLVRRGNSWGHEHEASDMQMDGSSGTRADGFLLDDAEGF